MLFANPADYDKIEQGDDLIFENFLEQIPTKKITVKNKTKGFNFNVVLDCTDNEVGVVLNGGQLSYLKKQLEKQGSL